MSQHPPVPIHAGPAGSIFKNIEHAGRHALKTNCDSYPQTTTSHILPPLFISKYPEGNDPATSKPQPRTNPPLNTNEQRTFDGICSGQGGEMIEYKVFNLFDKLLATQQDQPILILRDFELSTKGKVNFKQTTFMSEYPHITKISMRGEADYIVLLKDLGCVAIEVKRTLSVTSHQKAKDQLNHSELFLNQVMPAVAPSSQCLPIVKLIIFEMEDQKGPLASSSSTGYHYFNCSGDSIVAFEQKWKDIIQELQTNTPPNPLMPSEFKRLARLLTGLWCLKSMKRQPYFDVNDASLPHLTKEVDVRVNNAHLSSARKKRKFTNDPPLTNVVYNQPETVFRKANEINLMYLTPDQKNIYDNIQRGIIWGFAGAGKSLLILFKIIDLVQSPANNKKILLIAPHPHTIRCKNILEANNVVVVDSEKYSSGQPHDVVIIDVKEIFGIHHLEHLEYFNIAQFSSHHIFIDDFQSARARGNGNRILTKLNKAYEISSHNLSYCWCMVDEQQCYTNNNNGQLHSSDFYSKLYSNTGGNTGRATIPVYCLKDILRNTEEISKVVLNQRESNTNSCLNVIPHLAVRSSHKITSSLPTFHLLTNTWTKTTNDNDLVDFMIERLEDELRQLLRVSKPTTSPSDIAILHEDRTSPNSDVVKKRMNELLSLTFNITPMTIERQLETQTPTIVLDDVDNATSGEWPIVIFFNYDGSIFQQAYIACSRARTRLIEIRSDSTNFYKPGMKIVKWKKENNNFVQY